ncbi:hypothetical protein C8F04DRAFT_1085525 [Mycena alexandri]|uniref:Uncharacterized protein n=1 Tax=Mycena alexandri TaxID=1745969 RepID=A0AAD6T8Y4_9AGAR|nr:hypothetical protein C8F04DRAFT_1085525 [Mycena alexandri]
MLRCAVRLAKMCSQSCICHTGSSCGTATAAGETGGDVKLLPVLIKCADVFPVTQAHVDFVLAYIRGKTVEESRNYYGKPQVKLLLKGTDVEWIDERKKSIRFYRPKFDATAYVSDHPGNEPRPHEEGSIYLLRGGGVADEGGRKAWRLRKELEKKETSSSQIVRAAV